MHVCPLWLLTKRTICIKKGVNNLVDNMTGQADDGVFPKSTQCFVKENKVVIVAGLIYCHILTLLS